MAKFAIVATFELAQGQMDAFLPLLMPTEIAASRMNRVLFGSTFSDHGMSRTAFSSTRFTQTRRPSKSTGTVHTSHGCVQKPRGW